MKPAEEIIQEVTRFLQTQLDNQARDYKFNYEKTLYNLLKGRPIDDFDESEGKTDAKEFYDNYLKENL